MIPKAEKVLRVAQLTWTVSSPSPTREVRLSGVCRKCTSTTLSAHAI